MKRLMVIRKPLRYPAGNYKARVMLPGDTFEPRSDRDARLLLFAKRVSEVRDEAVIPPPPAELLAAVSPDIGELRKVYADKFGKKPYMGWDAATLTAKIEGAE